MVTENAISLPEYDNPPVVETVFGVTFNPVQIPTTAWGIYWKLLQPEFPKVDEAPPLESRIEIYQGESVELSGMFPFAPVRQMFTTSDMANVIQVQSNRFVFNWRKVTEEMDYPRYEGVYGAFEQQFAQFQEFLSKSNLTVTPIQYEMTYLNHIQLGHGENAFAEIEKVIPSFSLKYPGKQILEKPDSLFHRVSFPFPDRAGRLHITVRNGMVKEAPVVVFELTARGFPRTNMSRAEWFEMGRKWIVRGFTDFTSEKYQTEVWGRTR